MIRKQEEETTTTRRQTAQDNNNTTTTTPISQQPQVLTKQVIPTLPISALDASDVLECYYLTRPTVLANTNIKITKSALGIRYRPQQQQQQHPDDRIDNHRPLELTIEYGPSRNLDGSETIPRLITTENGDPSTTSEQQQQQTASYSSLLNWENDAKVYYTERIDSHVYTTANYLASLSGVVLTHLLHAAVEYGYNNTPRHKRYQPFTVYLDNHNDNHHRASKASTSSSNTTTTTTTTTTESQSETTTTTDNPVVLLKSSSDVDFLQRLFHVLAEMNVHLQPVIVPTTVHVQLHAQSVTKLQTGVAVDPRTVTEFYSKFYQCIRAISTANYTIYHPPPPPPTTVSSSSSSATPSTAPSISPPNHHHYYYRRSLSTVDNNPSRSSTFAPTTQPWRRRNSLSPSIAYSQPQPPSISPVQQDVTITTKTLAPATLDEIAKQHKEQAENAAQEAQKAADLANTADDAESAKNAAGVAAQAAKNAAETTANQAAQIAMNALLSGDTHAVASTISSCFADPMYGLSSSATTTTTPPSDQKDANGDDSNNHKNIIENDESNPMPPPPPPIVPIYLYWDGSFYYRVNLTAPYVTISSAVPIALPHPPVVGNITESVTDGGIFLLLLLFAGLGLLSLLQQVLGRNFQIVPPLYRYQRWFFQPTHYDLKDMDDESECVRMTSPGNNRYIYSGEDVIPLSMGGRRISAKSEDIRSWLRRRSASGSEHSIPEMEMTDMINNNNNHHNNALHNMNGTTDMIPFDRVISFHSMGVGNGGDLVDAQNDDDNDDGDFDAASDTPERLLRDPNLVDLPDLKSKSKVAVPVSVQFSQQQK